MLAGLIIIPMLILSIFLLVWLPTDTKWVSILPFATGVGAFIIRHGLNEWWYAKFPPKLAKIEKNILSKYFPYYQNLPAEQQAEFEKRVAIFRLQKKFQMRGKENPPGDIQLLISALGVQLTMGFPMQKEFFPKLGMVVMFAKTFITPNLRDQLHAVEFEQDIYDCLLLAVNMVVKGIREPQNYYNIGLYGMAKAFRLERGITEADMPIEDRKDVLLKLNLIRGFEIGYIFHYTALPDMEIFEMAVELFFFKPEVMHKELPAIYTYLVNLLGQDPLTHSPIVQNV
jgi:MtfA peptidase